MAVEMMRFLFLCLLLRAAIATENEYGSGFEEDDEDLVAQTRKPNLRMAPNKVDSDKSTGEEDEVQHQFHIIVIVVAVSVVALSIAAIMAAVVLVRRRMQNRPQGIYSVPAEQGQKGAV